MATVRTFIAVEATQAVRTRACDLIEHLQVTQAKVKWVGAGELHWTMKFLGDVETRQLPELCNAVAAAVAELPTFEIEAVGAGAFPTAQRPRTLWLGVGRGEAEFVELHDRVEAALGPLGYREEQRRFRPHMTLGRVRRSVHGVEELGRLVLDHANFTAGAMTVAEVVVFSSRLLRQGPVYEALGRAELKGESSL
jgi:2'-5' RNA ligase